jgi:tetratricopeptide (TPR) repeat protein
MAIKGSLKEAGLSDVCQLLALGRKTGCLSVSDGSRFGQIYFDSGRISYARIVNRRDRLGDLLVRDGALTSEMLADVLREQAEQPERPIGELLVASGRIGRDVLTRYVRLQIEEAIYHLFTWSRGNFFFEADALPEHTDVLVSINPEMLLLDAARRVDEWSLIEKKIPSLDLLFDVEKERLDAAALELTAEQQQMLPLLDGTRTVAEIADLTGQTEFDTGKALYGLVQAGFAHRVGRRTEKTELGRAAQVHERRNLGVAFFRTGMLPDAMRELERVLEIEPGDRAARYYSALILIRERRYREAVRALRTLLEEGGPHFGAFVNMALALRLMGRADDALLVLEAADAHQPGEPATQLARAATLLAAGRHAQVPLALQTYRRSLDPAQRPAAEYYYLAALERAIGRQPSQSAALLEEGLSAHPDSAPLLLMAGLLAERRGDVDGAERAYRKAITEDALLPQAHKGLGDIAYRRAAHQDALQSYLKAVELDETLGDDVLARIGNLLYRSRRTEPALEYWRRALQLNPDNSIVRNNLEIANAAG